MTIFGLGSRSEPSGEVSATFRAGWIRHFRVALSSACGGAVILGIFELLKQSPEGFKVLEQWGPWPVIALVALVLMGSFLAKLNETIQTTFGAIVTSVQQQALAGNKTADALTRLADQGGRQAEEIRRMAMYAGREFPAVYDRLDQIDKSIGDVHEGLKALHYAVNMQTAKAGGVNS